MVMYHLAAAGVQLTTADLLCWPLHQWRTPGSRWRLCSRPSPPAPPRSTAPALWCHPPRSLRSPAALHYESDDRKSSCAQQWLLLFTLRVVLVLMKARIACISANINHESRYITFQTEKLGHRHIYTIRGKAAKCLGPQADKGAWGTNTLYFSAWLRNVASAVTTTLSVLTLSFQWHPRKSSYNSTVSLAPIITTGHEVLIKENEESVSVYLKPSNSLMAMKVIYRAPW